MGQENQEKSARKIKLKGNLSFQTSNLNELIVITHQNDFGSEISKDNTEWKDKATSIVQQHDG